MTHHFPPAFLDEVRARTPLPKLIGRKVKLTRAGDDLKGCCPFHDDRTPSFTVYDDGYHCFGCGAHGDVISFVMQSQGLEFKPAVIQLAADAGLPLPHHINGTPHHINGKSRSDPPKAAPDDDWVPMVPPPADAPQPSKADLRCDVLHTYRDAGERVLFYVRRFEARNGKGKRFLPLTYGTLNGHLGWHTRHPDALRPLYGLDRLARRPEAPVIVCEGEKAADAAGRLFPDRVCLTWPGGAKAVDKADWQPVIGRKAEIVIWPDNDAPGHEAAAKVKALVPGARVLRVDDLPDGHDAADVQPDDPKAWLRERLPKPTRGTWHGRLLVLDSADVDTATPRSYLLKGLLSPAEVSLWVGPPKCGKSFLLLHVAYMLSLGRPVFGRRVKTTKVLYVAAEGEAGIANRVRALRDKYGHSDNFRFIAQPADLLHEGGHQGDLIAAAHATGAQLIVLDTLSRLMAGGDENSPQDMGCFVRNVGEVRHLTHAHVAIVHHGTKASNGSNPRGHSSLTGADDALIEVLKLNDGSRVATVVHAKDDADGIRWGFGLDVVELGTDEDGDPITTLLVNEAAEPPAEIVRPERLSDNLQIGLKTLRSAMTADTILTTVGEDNAEVAVVTEADWRSWFYREGKPGENQETKQRAFRRMADGLLAKGLIGSRDGFIWPIGRKS